MLLKIAKYISSLTAIAILLFVAGLVIGAYYHNELGVIWRSIASYRASGAPIETISAEPPGDLASNKTITTLNMSQLDEPLPLIYSDTLEEKIIQEHLKEGAVILPLGTSFGEAGNVVITAHSSGTKAFGPYRFAFASLSDLTAGQEFEIDTNDVTYHYRVYDKEIVWPHEVDKLPDDDRSTVTLVTCWPLWTNFKRLLVHAELTQVDYHAQQ